MKLILINSDTGRFLALGIPDTDDLAQATTFSKQNTDRARAVQAVMAKHGREYLIVSTDKLKGFTDANEPI